jgi:hypothetical protein
MPRIYDSASNPVDYCKRCMPGEKVAEERHGNVGDGPDGRGNCYGYNDDHPDYADEDYKCVKCRRKLGANDN